MAFAPEDLNTIDAAIASGVKRITFADGRTTEYQSAADMLAVRREITASLNQAANTAAGRPRKRFARFGTGF